MIMSAELCISVCYCAIAITSFNRFDTVLLFIYVRLWLYRRSYEFHSFILCSPHYKYLFIIMFSHCYTVFYIMLIINFSLISIVLFRSRKCGYLFIIVLLSLLISFVLCCYLNHACSLIISLRSTISIALYCHINGHLICRCVFITILIFFILPS